MAAGGIGPGTAKQPERERPVEIDLMKQAFWMQRIESGQRFLIIAVVLLAFGVAALLFK